MTLTLFQAHNLSNILHSFSCGFKDVKKKKKKKNSLNKFQDNRMKLFCLSLFGPCVLLLVNLLPSNS